MIINQCTGIIYRGRETPQQIFTASISVLELLGTRPFTHVFKSLHGEVDTLHPQFWSFLLSIASCKGPSWGVTRSLLSVPRRYHNHGRSCNILALKLLDGRRSCVTGLPARLCEAGSELCARRGVGRVLQHFFGKDIYYIYI